MGSIYEIPSTTMTLSTTQVVERDVVIGEGRKMSSIYKKSLRKEEDSELDITDNRPAPASCMHQCDSSRWKKRHQHSELN